MYRKTGIFRINLFTKTNTNQIYCEDGIVVLFKAMFVIISQKFNFQKWLNSCQAFINKALYKNSHYMV